MEGWVSRSCYWSVFPLSFSFNLTYLTLLRMLDVADVTKSFVNHVQTSLARQAYNLGMSLPSYPSLFASSSPFLAPFLHTLPLVMKKGTLISTQSRQSRRISSCGSFGPGQSSCASSLPLYHPLTHSFSFHFSVSFLSRSRPLMVATNTALASRYGSCS